MTVAIIGARTLSGFPQLSTTGFALRKPTKGPEYLLVERYVSSSLPIAPAGQKCTVFIEPRVATCFPDIVAVYWDEHVAKRWLPQRAGLTPFDVKVLHYLAAYGTSELTKLRTVFRRGISAAIARLQEAELVVRAGKNWLTQPLQSIFAVRRLVAIEAKITAWQSGLSQALLNTWFASESYLLLDKLPRRAGVVEEARRLGLGVVISTRTLDNPLAVPTHEGLPKSYVSWLFNEWVWRASTVCRETAVAV